MRLKQQNKTTRDTLTELICWVGDARERIDELETALVDLRRMRGNVVRFQQPLSWEHVVEAIDKRAGRLYSELLRQCEPQLVRMGKVRTLAPDGLIYARLNLGQDSLRQALEDEFGIAFDFKVLHKLD